MERNIVDKMKKIKYGNWRRYGIQCYECGTISVHELSPFTKSASCPSCTSPMFEKLVDAGLGYDSKIVNVGKVMKKFRGYSAYKKMK